jgi:bacteriochlorophyll 4-vinyl reductase
MSEGVVGRLLVASLHQGIADLLPSRLEFYESWLNPAGLRDGRIGLAPLAAVLSFLRQDGESYHLIAARAGEYTAEWTVADLPALRRTIIRAAPRALRLRLAMRVAGHMVRNTYRGSRVRVRWGKASGTVEIRGSIFCEVRDRVEQPLCEFYASALRRLLQLFSLDVEVGMGQCRATGAGQCMMSMLVRAVAVESP